MDEARTRKHYRNAAKLIIGARIRDGWEHITLSYLYDVLGASGKVACNGVLWAIQDLKHNDELAKTSERGVYQVVL